MQTALLVRDNRYKMNWGCRATTNALEAILRRHFTVTTMPPIHDIGAKLPVGQHEDIVVLEPNIASNYFLRRASSGELIGDAQVLYDSIYSSDLVVVNLEGCAILSTPYRRDLRFSNFIAVLAASMNTKVAVVNGMLSLCPATPLNQQALEETVSALHAAHFVSFRDQVSQEFAHTLGIAESYYFPDALFSWLRQFPNFFDSGVVPLAALEVHPERRLPFTVEQSTLAPIAISAGSKHPSEALAHSTDFYRSLVGELNDEFDNPIVLVSPGGDFFLEPIAQEFGIQSVRGDTNVLMGAKFLAGCRLYISGRYHPSVMASLGGTPCVFLESNSHKTDSLASLLEYDWTESLSSRTPADVDAVVGRARSLLMDESHRHQRRHVARGLARKSETMVELLLSGLSL